MEKLNISTVQPRHESLHTGTALDSRRVKYMHPQRNDDKLVKSSAPEDVASSRAAQGIVDISNKTNERKEHSTQQS
eukprot:15341063-Ditylum_brightwellii.AAC.2